MSTTPREAFIADLEMVVGRLREVHDKLRDECREHGAEFTPEQEARWEGSFLMVRGALVDELGPMLRTWKEGHQFSRKGEKIAEASAKSPNGGSEGTGS